MKRIYLVVFRKVEIFKESVILGSVFMSCVWSPINQFIVRQCFTFRIILGFYTILRVFVLYSHYSGIISSKKLNGHQTFDSLSLLGPL